MIDEAVALLKDFVPWVIGVGSAIWTLSRSRANDEARMQRLEGQIGSQAADLLSLREENRNLREELRNRERDTIQLEGRVSVVQGTLNAQNEQMDRIERAVERKVSSSTLQAMRDLRVDPEPIPPARARLPSRHDPYER